VTNRHTADSITSDALDQLYDERDEARQHAAAIAAQRDRLRFRMNALADRWDHALAPDKPYAHTLRAEISVAPFDPAGAMTVQEYTERGRRLWAFRCWGTETCDGWLGLGHHTQTAALLERERHAREEHAEAAPVSSGPAETEATEPVDTCRPVEVDGETILVRGSGQFTDQEQQFASEIVRAAKRKYAVEHPEPKEPTP
jgi:hypothetical protein